MELVKVERERPEPRHAMPQLVPSSACLRCDVCCRFPEADSFLRPYFTGQEIADAVAGGVDPGMFPEATGSQITLVTNPLGEGYLCPAFDPATYHCRIYASRPLDCRLYPFALMWDAGHKEVLLGWDSKCPYMGEVPPPSIAAEAERVTAFLSTDELVETIAAHPRLIGRFQEDVVVIRPLPDLTVRVNAGHRKVDARLAPFTVAQAARFAQALERSGLLEDGALAAYAFPYHVMWTSLLSYWWLERDETFYLVAKSPDGYFMPLPPLGPHPLERTVHEAVGLMEQWNGSSPVSRIESIMAPQKAILQEAGFHLASKDGDYLYDAQALATLAGDRYKSQRALCNRIEREQSVELRPYAAEDRASCVTLYERWAHHKQVGGTGEEFATLLLEDASLAHRRVFAEGLRWGLKGEVALIEGTIVAYTFGYWLTPRTFCVLLEVADRTVPGLAQYLFRATCRRAAEHGARAINAMEDSGLPGLRAAKLAYHPVTVIGNWTLLGR